jgi:hypothetical protein
VVLDVTDAGRYTLRSESKAGFDEADVLLVVLEAPWVNLRDGAQNYIEASLR